MDYLFSAFVFSAAAENVHNADETTDEPLPEIDKSDTVIEETELKRKLAYYSNRHFEATSDCPVFYGAHINKRNELNFTAKFVDQQCYEMTPARRKKGEIPFLKDSKIINTRCRNKAVDGGNHAFCNARFLAEWKLDVQILEDFTDIDLILDMGKFSL